MYTKACQRQCVAYDYVCGCVNSQSVCGFVDFVCCSPCRCEFAIATSDGQVFVRQFALNPEGMHLVRTLKGHHSEVTQVR